MRCVCVLIVRTVKLSWSYGNLAAHSYTSVQIACTPVITDWSRRLDRKGSNESHRDESQYSACDSRYSHSRCQLYEPVMQGIHKFKFVALMERRSFVFSQRQPVHKT